MPKHGTTKPQTVNYHRVPRNLWRKVKRHLPHEPKEHRPQSLAVDPRIVTSVMLSVAKTTGEPREESRYEMLRCAQRDTGHLPCGQSMGCAVTSRSSSI